MYGGNGHYGNPSSPQQQQRRPAPPPPARRPSPLPRQPQQQQTFSPPLYSTPQQQPQYPAATSFSSAPHPQQQQQAAWTDDTKTNGSYNTPSSYASPTTTTTTSPYRRQQYVGPATTYATTSPYGYGATSTTQSSSTSLPPRLFYQHNTAVALAIVPVLYWTLTSHPSSSYPSIIFGMSILLLYALDLANQRNGVFYTLWFLVPVNTLVNGWFWLIETDDADVVDASSGWITLEILFQMVLTALLFIAIVCWAALQSPWLIQKQDKTVTTLAKQLQACLHAALPTVVGALASHYIVLLIILPAGGIDVAATAAPLLFAFLLWVTMMMLGSSTDSFVPNKKNSKDTDDKLIFCISQNVALGHVAVLLIVPPFMHFSTFYARIWSSYSSLDDWCDWILSFTVPYLLLVLTGILHEANLKQSPYGELSFVTVPTVGLVGMANSSGGSLPTVASIFPLGMTLLSSLAFQQRYLIPAVHRFSYMFLGVYPSSWLLSVYWTIATISLMVALWLWGRKSSVTGELLFGEYQEDIVQLSLALTGAALGKGVGMPWNFTPLPILAFLGLTLWMSTRMLRYLAIFLFVIHATAFVTFTYRFAGMSHTIHLSFPNIEANLVQFGMMAIASSILVGLVTGMAVRSTGGFLSETLRKIDFTGVLLVLYTVFLVDLEMSLFKRDAPGSELSGMYSTEDSGARQDALYSFGLGVGTSSILVGLALFMKRLRIISARSSGIVVSLAVAKCAMFYGEAVYLEMGVISDVSFVQTVVLSVIVMIMFTPSVFLTPVHIKTSSRYKRSLAGESALPSSVTRTLMLYNLLFLPLILLVAVDLLQPVYHAFLQHQGGLFSASFSFSMIISGSLAVWSVASLSMLNHYLPDGGGEHWKKFSALAFLISILIFLVTSPYRGTNIQALVSNPYIAASSLGSKLQSRSKRRNGIWGISSAILATILAMTGVLDLKERRSRTGVKDRFFMFRSMMFSLLFGGGVTWFVVMQTMSEADTAFLILTMTSSLIVSCLGTITAVMGHFIELDNFDEIEELGRTWFFAFALFMAVAGLPQLLTSPTVGMFEAGGWLSTYLAICSLATFSLATAYRLRSTKNAKTSAQNNIFCVTSWVCGVVVLFGRFGVAGLDTASDATTLFGFPLPVVGTLAASLILLGLEGESAVGSGRRISTSGSRRVVDTSFWSLPLPQLKSTNRFFPLFISCACAFALATVYSIFLRGSWLLVILGGSLPKAHDNVFANVVGSTKGASAVSQTLEALAQESIRQSQSLFASAKLMEAGLWTTSSFISPILHMTGLILTVPTIYFAIDKWWASRGPQQYQPTIPVSFVTLATLLNVFPLLFCHGIACLRAVAYMNLVAGGIHVTKQRQANRMSNMEL